MHLYSMPGRFQDGRTDICQGGDWLATSIPPVMAVLITVTTPPPDKQDVIVAVSLWKEYVCGECRRVGIWGAVICIEEDELLRRKMWMLVDS